MSDEEREIEFERTISTHVYNFFHQFHSIGNLVAGEIVKDCHLKRYEYALADKVNRGKTNKVLVLEEKVTGEDFQYPFSEAMIPELIAAIDRLFPGSIQKVLETQKTMKNVDL